MEEQPDSATAEAEPCIGNDERLPIDTTVPRAESVEEQQSRLMMKEVALMSLERMLVNKAILVRQREQACDRQEDSLRERRRKFSEARAVLDVQRAMLERELRIFDRAQLLTVREDVDTSADVDALNSASNCGGRKRRLWRVVNDAFPSDAFDDLPSAKERRVDTGRGSLAQGSSGHAGEFFIDWDMPSGLERTALRDDPRKVSIGKPFMTAPEYNFLLDLLNAFRKCPHMTVLREIYERIMPEACLLRENMKTKLFEVVDKWNAIPFEKRISAQVDLYPVTFIGASIVEVAFEAETTIPEDFVQVLEVALNVSLLDCWWGGQQLLRKTTRAMSAISVLLSAMVWKGHLQHHDQLLQLNVFIATTMEVLAKHRNSKGISSFPGGDISTFFLPVPHFAASFLHPAIFQREDVMNFLVKYIINNNMAAIHIVKGFFWMLQEDLDRIPALNRNILAISNHMLKIISALNDKVFQVACLKLLLYGDASVQSAGILDGLCSMRCSMHRWNLLFVAKNLSQLLEEISGEQYKWKEALWWLKWVIRSSGKLPDGWQGEITEWLKAMVPDVRGVE